jgi:hypothetical protein
MFADLFAYFYQFADVFAFLVLSAAGLAVIFGMMGNGGYRWVLRRNQRQRWDAHRVLHWIYQPGPLKRLLLPWARRRYHSQRRDESCDHVNCTCVWCRHGGHRIAGAEKACGN